ncbi:vanadium-dependent haloperoxidase [Flagellimonas allohymeniacidonis]|uniref:Phosphatase PAP2 family protein n=1 Tax=Flagellimonas allohymeniacidonis TaxID=2517819 RepID=A0A4Q8QIV9_9FLAO|nr:vanadium-dependent haloperoxidase [Allomuricauda hymeniacidonis]TAI48136.1 phosphatase PAP2 family protein [Allomuricauda hymeniacidonis]
MKTIRQFLSNYFLPIILLTVQSCTTKEIKVEEYSPEVINSWNQKIFEIAIEEDGLLTLKGLRTASMVHVAIHDALNTIVPLYTSYAYQSEPTMADPIATAAYTAYLVTVDQYPDKQSELKQELDKWLTNETQNSTVVKKLGRASATSILQKRTRDAWNGEAEYTWHPMAPGVYAEFNEHSGTPEGFIFGAGWAKAQPFMLPRQDFFRSPPPPDIKSDAYTIAFNEVKEVGQTQSETRTADQTHFALWWKDFVENSHNRLARELVTKEALNLWEASRLFALLNMTVYDAYINVFDNKFHYNHWRPYTAIRWAEHDENPDTAADVEWNNLHQHTYAFPSYPSAHGTASAAAMTALAHTLGKGDDYLFVMTTEEVDSAGPFSEKLKMDPPTRSFTSFSDAGWEASLSRVYLGIHFRYDSEEGKRLGTQIGQYAAENYLQALAIP